MYHRTPVTSQTPLTSLQTERSYQTRYNELLARQYRIVNPGASEAEIESAVQQGDSQVFSQALLSSNRSASANSVATAVRERQADIQRIERTILELAELFEQMNEQVVLSEPVVEAIEDLTSKVDTDLEGANIQLKQAVKSGYSARRKKFWCLGIGIAILLIIVAIVVIVVFVNKGKITPAPAPVPRMIKA